MQQNSIVPFQELQSQLFQTLNLFQDTIRKWEKAVKETRYICNQSAGFNRCLTKIQDSVQEQLRILQSELGKRKSSSKAQSALDELHYLTSFNQNISFAVGKSLKHLSDFTFTQMANLTLLRRDSYLEHLKQGVKPDTFSALRYCPLNRYALVPDAVIRKAEDEIAQYETSKRTSGPGPWGGSLVGTSKLNKIDISPTLPDGRVRRLPNQRWQPILDLSALKFLSVKIFKMETPETIRISLKQGEWVTSLDFSDAYFHIPIHTGSRKFLRFHFRNQSYQFWALPFGLSTAPMEFTCVVKEVKLMAQSWGIKIHQYLDNWLIRAPTKELCHQGTQSLLGLCKELGWIVNLQKSELEPKQVFEFVGYQYDLLHGLVKPTQNHWEAILQKVESILANPTFRVRKFMSLIGLLTATEKQVPLGRLHLRPIQLHLKRHWRVPESLEKEIPVPRTLHPHLSNVLLGQPLHPLSHVVQIFTDASKEGWDAHLGYFTFTQFYLKDAAWADSKLFPLGPVVAAQQIHH